jgi:hypothetical protein
MSVYASESRPLRCESGAARPSRAGRFLAVFFFGTLFLGASLCRAGSIEKLTDTLLRHKSYKVRLQSAVLLAKKRDPRSYTALVQCIQFDSHYLVRGLCATALGRLGNMEAKKLLLKARKDKHKFVRKRATAALRRLQRSHLPDGPRDWTIPPPRRARYYVALGSMATSRRHRIHKTYRKRMKQGFWQALAQEKRLTLGLASDKAPASFLKKHKLKAYELDASLVHLRSRKKGRKRKIRAKIRVTLARYPKMNIVMITTGAAAATQKMPSGLDREERRSFYHRLKLEAIDSAVRSAAKNVIGYLKRR